VSEKLLGYPNLCRHLDGHVEVAAVLEHVLRDVRVLPGATARPPGGSRGVVRRQQRLRSRDMTASLCQQKRGCLTTAACQCTPAQHQVAITLTTM
jgi:hypothetical protein